MNAGRSTISDICNGSKILHIPYYQRPYVWDNDEWERFLEDMENVSQSSELFFMGSIILKKQPPTTDDSAEVLTVIDGQQRLTTFCIMAKVLCLKNDNAEAFNKRFKLDNGSPVIQHNRNDKAVFNAIMNLSRFDDDSELMKKQDRVSRAYRYFKDYLNPEKLNFNKVFTKNVLFVVIDLLDNEDEQQIFETVNSIGTSLTTADLLKNYLFDRNNESAYQQYWDAVFEATESDRKFWNREILANRRKTTCIDLFFYAYLQIKIQDPALKVPSDEKAAYSKVDQLFRHYKDFVKKRLRNNKQMVINEVGEYAEIFRRIINPDAVQNDLPRESGIDRMNVMIFGVGATTLIPYFLYVERNVLDEIEKKKIYACLESFIMRRLITKQLSKNYGPLFNNQLISNQIQTRNRLEAHLNKMVAVNRIPRDDEVREAFHNATLSNQHAISVLYMIESRIRDSAHSTSLLGLKKYSLEHMMPKKWRNCWSLKKGENADERNHILLTLGNLTIITQSLNASIQNADWNTKKNGKGRNGGLLKYASGLDTLFDYLQYKTWDEAAIQKRADDLADRALEIWKL